VVPQPDGRDAQLAAEDELKRTLMMLMQQVAKSLYSATDTTFTAAGKVALWTKADSVTYFDDLRIQTP
jgi:hypothetical protein